MAHDSSTASIIENITSMPLMKLHTRRASPPTLPLVMLLLALLMLGGCASTPGRTPLDNDPWHSMNRGIYTFNDGLDRYALKPVAKGYKKVTPTWVRSRVGSFFGNLTYPITAVNQLLQGKPKLFAQDTGRFVTNTVFGIAGLFDVADKMGMPQHDEDFGQTLAVWGVPSGPYLMLPIFGPSTLRDGPAKVPDYFISPMRYADITTLESLSIRALDLVDTRAQLLSTEAALEGAYDRYGIVRDAWLQRREYMIFDGDPPIDEPEFFDDEEEPAAGDSSTGSESESNSDTNVDEDAANGAAVTPEN
jgi:phospholipid-binding lipoprotein MlaA